MGVAARLDLNGATPAVPRYATYLGGTSDDLGHGVAMKVAGLVYLTGYTRSANFPITAGAYQGTLRGARDAFAAKGRLLTRALVVSKTVEWNRITPNPPQVFQICVTGPSYPTPTATDTPTVTPTATAVTPCYFADVEPNADHSNPALCDGDVDIADVQRIAGCWNQPLGADCLPGLDLDRSGVIDILDVIMDANEWGWRALPPRQRPSLAFGWRRGVR